MRAYEQIIDLGTKPHPVVVALRLWLAVDLSLHAPKQQLLGKRQLGIDCRCLYDEEHKM